MRLAVGEWYNLFTSGVHAKAPRLRPSPGTLYHSLSPPKNTLAQIFRVCRTLFGISKIERTPRRDSTGGEVEEIRGGTRESPNRFRPLRLAYGGSGSDTPSTDAAQQVIGTMDGYEEDSSVGPGADNVAGSGGGRRGRGGVNSGLMSVVNDLESLSYKVLHSVGLWFS